MILLVLGIYDVKADAFTRPPFFMGTRGQATRAFADLATAEQSEVAKHPEDYKLMVLGTFDDNTGELKPQQIESLGFASEYVRGEVTPLRKKE